MCYHKYTHFGVCTLHVPMHTHTCPKNINEDAARVLYCEDYQTIRVKIGLHCPYCLAMSAPPTSSQSTANQAYPSPPCEDGYA